MEENNETKRRRSGSSRELAKWFSGRRNNVERWVDETCRGAIARARGVVAEEIRGLSRRVERVHELLDQFEQMVDAQPSDADGDGDSAQSDETGDGESADGDS